MTTCSVCRSPHVSEIEAAVESGQTLTETGRTYRVGRDAIRRHLRHPPRVRHGRHGDDAPNVDRLATGTARRLLVGARPPEAAEERPADDDDDDDDDGPEDRDADRDRDREYRRIVDRLATAIVGGGGRTGRSEAGGPENWGREVTVTRTNYAGLASRLPGARSNVRT